MLGAGEGFLSSSIKTTDVNYGDGLKKLKFLWYSMIDFLAWQPWDDQR